MGWMAMAASAGAAQLAPRASFLFLVFLPEPSLPLPPLLLLVLNPTNVPRSAPPMARSEIACGSRLPWLTPRVKAWLALPSDPARSAAHRSDSTAAGVAPAVDAFSSLWLLCLGQSDHAVEGGGRHMRLWLGAGSSAPIWAVTRCVSVT
jgi:hypothetical protein